MSVAPARSSRPSRVMSDTLVSTRDLGSVGGQAGHVDGGQRQQVRVAVVEDPVLRPGQQRREPASHRTAAAGEIVDDQRPSAKPATESPDELVASGRRHPRLRAGRASSG